METHEFGGVPVNLFLPLDEVEPGALDQIITTSNHPSAYEKLAVMPDCHQGYGVTIGTIFTTRNAVVPNAVGVDIGCGVAVAKTRIKLDRDVMGAEFFTELDRKVRRDIPVGMKGHAEPRKWEGFTDPVFGTDPRGTRAWHQLGTLGGGNHFLEYAVGQDGYLYAMVHSGSRGFGHMLATKHQKIAVAMNDGRREYHKDPKDLESFRVDDEVGQNYLRDMNVAILYAKQSREQMLLSLLVALTSTMKGEGIKGATTHPDWAYDCCHNYAKTVLDGNESVVMHRKGAVDATEGTRGVIPGSMGSPTFLTTGKGNPDAWYSSSHGAGRKMGRKAAERTFDMQAFQQAMTGTYSSFGVSILDESPMAYKDVGTVIERQQDCVAVDQILYPLLTVKGGGRDEG
jgi:tRNA-splicing ligase RtcB (3'-phosphate/5'-hydroxy nucleic acid ligase)